MQSMYAGVTTALFAALLLAGCAGDTPSSPAPSSSPTSDAPPSRPPAPTPAATPAPSVPGDAPVLPATPPAPGADEEATAEGYVAPVFDAQEKVATAADPAAFADVNPIDYRNPWR